MLLARKIFRRETKTMGLCIQETSLDVSSWPKGVYMLCVGSRTEKIIVK